MRHATKPRTGLFATAAVALLAAACSTGAPNAGENPGDDRSGSGGTLVIGTTSAQVPIPNTPPSDGAEGIRWVGNSVYDALTTFDLDQNEKPPVPQPGLAERWEVSDDKLTWRFHLRKGITFHDGTKFDANAVVFQLDRITKKGSRYFDQQLFGLNQSYTQHIKSYRAVADDTVQITTDERYSLLPWDLTSIYFPSPKAVQKHGNQDYAQHPVGTGPFKVLRYSGSTMDMAAFGDYWGGRPKLDRLTLKALPDSAGRMAALQSGTINWADAPPPDLVPQLKAQNFQLLSGPYPHTMTFTLDLYEKPFNNPKVREALQYAIDREEMCDKLLGGMCEPADQLAYQGHPWHDTALNKHYAYNPQRAKRLLREAGYPDGLSIRVASPTGGSGNMFPGLMTEFMQSKMAAAGIKLDVQPLEFNIVRAMLRAGFTSSDARVFDAIYFSTSWNTPFLADRFSSSRIPPKGCCNAMGYRNKQVDAAFAAVSREFDLAKQDRQLSNALGAVAADSPMTFIVHDLNTRALSPKVRGFVQPQAWYVDLTTVWVQP